MPTICKFLMIAAMAASLSSAMAALPTCGNVYLMSVYHVGPASNAPAGEAKIYRIVALVKNLSQTESTGFRLSLTDFAADPEVVQYQSSHTLLKPGESGVQVEVARSTERMGSSGATGTFNISQSYLAQEQLKFDHCPAYTRADILFQTQTGREYTIQHSADLQKWQDLEVIKAKGEAMLWRGLSTLTPLANATSGFFRVQTTCVGAEDCDEQIRSINRSSTALHDLYQPKK